MLSDMELTKKKLSGLWQNPKVEVLKTKRRRYAIISDLHLGDGGEADDFSPNEAALLNALEHYYSKKYKLILLGDVEEFWQFELGQIISQYGETIYKKIRSFGDKNVYRIFGNHDSEWAELVDPLRNHAPKLHFASEAVKMRDTKGRISILLVHGHQGTRNSDKNSWVSRFFVRLFKSVKPVAKRARLYRPRSATKSQVPDSFERTYYSWARESKVILVCGHTHRAMFASRSYAQRLQAEVSKLELDIQENAPAESDTSTRVDRVRKLRKELEHEQKRERTIDIGGSDSELLPCYFNSGCALYTDGITTLEIENDEIRLVKWHNKKESGTDFEIYERGSITSYVNKLSRTH
jgi:UDP-2,3-diacylglucosamine pyrophosphatase LpxH